MSDCIIERHGGVMLVRFNRPDRMNAMGGTLVQELDEAIKEGQMDDRIRAFVVTGEGRAWCAGADLAPGGGVGEAAPKQEERHDKRARALDRLGGAGRTVLQIFNCDKPTIAAINGVTVGGGFGLASCFDIRIASDQARFSTIFIKRALAPDFGLSYFLPRLVGPERARELFFTGRMVSAQEALELGIVSKVVPHENLMESAMGLAQEIAANSPTAVTVTRRALNYSLNANLEEQLAFEWIHQRQQLASAEFQEGVAAFREKRAPDYSKF